MVVALVSGCSGCTSQETHDFFNDPAWEDYKKDNQGVVWGSGGVTPTPSPVEESTEEELMDHNSDLGNGA